jgi:hypothetical protein
MGDFRDLLATALTEGCAEHFFLLAHRLAKDIKKKAISYSLAIESCPRIMREVVLNPHEVDSVIAATAEKYGITVDRLRQLYLEKGIDTQSLAPSEADPGPAEVLSDPNTGANYVYDPVSKQSLWELPVGSHVEAQNTGHAAYQRGKIVENHCDGTCTIHFADDTMEIAKRVDIRELPEIKGNGAVQSPPQSAYSRKGTKGGGKGAKHSPRSPPEGGKQGKGGGKKGLGNGARGGASTNASEWVAYDSPQGVYYYNQRTGISSWSKPADPTARTKSRGPPDSQTNSSDVGGEASSVDNGADSGAHVFSRGLYSPASAPEPLEGGRCNGCRKDMDAMGWGYATGADDAMYHCRNCGYRHCAQCLPKKYQLRYEQFLHLPLIRNTHTPTIIHKLVHTLTLS